MIGDQEIVKDHVIETEKEGNFQSTTSSPFFSIHDNKISMKTFNLDQEVVVRTVIRDQRIQNEVKKSQVEEIDRDLENGKSALKFHWISKFFIGFFYSLVEEAVHAIIVAVDQSPDHIIEEVQHHQGMTRLL